ncbi:MAG: FMN-binding protein [Bacteroidales bacterium]
MMNLKGAIFLGVLVFGFLTAGAQTEVDYQHKRLVKTLKKEGIANPGVLREMVVPDALSNGRSINGKYFQVEPTPAGSVKYVYVGRVNSCRTGGCSISNEPPEEGSSEYFDYFIFFDQNRIIIRVSVFNYQATHGHEVTARGWLKQFVGHEGSRSLQIDKNIDSISGATISVHAITTDVEVKTTLLNQILN